MVVDVGRVAELPGQQDGAALLVVEQDGGAVAPVVGLALLGHPGLVAATVVEGGAAQHVPARRGELDVAHDHAGIPVQIASGLVQPGPAPVIGDVDAGLR